MGLITAERDILKGTFKRSTFFSSGDVVTPQGSYAFTKATLPRLRAN